MLTRKLLRGEVLYLACQMCKNLVCIFEAIAVNRKTEEEKFKKSKVFITSFTRFYNRCLIFMWNLMNNHETTIPPVDVRSMN